MWKALVILVAFAIPVSTTSTGLLPETEAALKQAEHLYGQFIMITSAYRTPEWNTSVGGVPGSYHLSGEAIDIRMPLNATLLVKLVWALRQAGLKGICFYNTHIHAHIRKNAIFWRS